MTYIINVRDLEYLKMDAFSLMYYTLENNQINVIGKTQTTSTK